MISGAIVYVVVTLAALSLGCVLRAEEPPPIPVGLDAYRMWDRWAYQRVGARAYMRSTYDRSGGNEGADASHFLYQAGDDFNVTLDLQGAGVLYFVRYNHWHGSPWHFVVDGADHVVTETSTADPKHPAPDSVFEPHEAFPTPLAWTWADTRGADLIGVPIGFEHSFQMAYSRTHYGTGYYIYQQFVPGAKLSRSIRAWDGRTTPNRDVLELISRSGSDLLAGVPRMKSESTVADLAPNSSIHLELGDGPTMIRGIEISCPKESALALSNVRLKVWWDGRSEPSVDAPISLFFGAGTLYNRDGVADLVKAFPVNVHFDQQRVSLRCWFPMPFFRSAKIELSGAGEKIDDVHLACRSQPFGDSPTDVGYFHATYRDHPAAHAGEDLVLLDTRQTEGGGDWSGSFIGTSFIFSHAADLNTLEGDPRFYFDDSLTPQGQGTGTEEWGGGGDYWGGRNMTLPFFGHPCGGKANAAINELDKIESAYRFLLADLMPFGKNARITLEHGGTNESREHYETVAYWYGLPAAWQVKTDELSVGDLDSERSHDYRSPQASRPYELSSRYEWGLDHLKGEAIFPEQTDQGRTTTGTSEFTLRLRQDNLGVLLRRKLDYSFPNQRADVFVSSAEGGKRPDDWKPAGTWYLAGSNTCVYSNPRDELGRAEHKVETSNRRFRDDEFLLPLALTRGRSSIRVRVKFKPMNVPLFPGATLAPQAWSEMRYGAYCYVRPAFSPP